MSEISNLPAINQSVTVHSKTIDTNSKEDTHLAVVAHYLISTIDEHQQSLSAESKQAAAAASKNFVRQSNQDNQFWTAHYGGAYWTNKSFGGSSGTDRDELTKKSLLTSVEEASLTNMSQESNEKTEALILQVVAALTKKGTNS